MSIFSFLPQRFGMWSVAVFIFLVSLGVSTQPSFISGFAPFSNLYLIVLSILLLLAVGEMSLWLLILFGLMIDVAHHNVLGVSSLLLLLLVPLIKISLGPTAQFSVPRFWLTFMVWISSYKTSLLIVLSINDMPIDIFSEFSSLVFSILLFPIFLAVALWLFRRYS